MVKKTKCSECGSVIYVGTEVFEDAHIAFECPECDAVNEINLDELEEA